MDNTQINHPLLDYAWAKELAQGVADILVWIFGRKS